MSCSKLIDRHPQKFGAVLGVIAAISIHLPRVASSETVTPAYIALEVVGALVTAAVLGFLGARTMNAQPVLGRHFLESESSEEDGAPQPFQ